MCGWGKMQGGGGEKGEGAVAVEIQIKMISEERRRRKGEEEDEKNFTRYPKLVMNGNTSLCVPLCVKDIVRGRCSGMKLPAERFPV